VSQTTELTVCACALMKTITSFKEIPKYLGTITDLKETSSKHILLLQLPEYYITEKNTAPFIYNRVTTLPNDDYYKEYSYLKYFFANHNYFKLNEKYTTNNLDLSTKVKIIEQFKILDSNNLLFDFSSIIKDLAAQMTIFIQKTSSYGNSFDNYSFFTKCNDSLRYELPTKIIDSKQDNKIITVENANKFHNTMKPSTLDQTWRETETPIPTHKILQDAKETVLNLLADIKRQYPLSDTSTVPRLSIQTMNIKTLKTYEYCLCRLPRECKHKHTSFRDTIYIEKIIINTSKTGHHVEREIPLALKINNSNYFKVIALICSELATISQADCNFISYK